MKREPGRAPQEIDFLELLRGLEADGPGGREAEEEGRGGGPGDSADADGPPEFEVDWNAEALRDFRRVVALHRARRARRKRVRTARAEERRRERAAERLWRAQCSADRRAAGPSAAPVWLLAGSLAVGLVGAFAVVAALVFAADRSARSSADTARAVGSEAEEGAAAASAESPDAAGAAEAPGGADPSAPRVDEAWLARVAAQTGIPSRALEAYAAAANRLGREQPGCGLGWNTLAGIGFVESEHGAISGGTIAQNGSAVPRIVGIPLDGRRTDAIRDTDGGALDGDAVWDRAVGPMQFIPSTWAVWGSDGNGDGAADPQNIDDAAYSAARYLCSTGGDLRDPER